MRFANWKSSKSYENTLTITEIIKCKERPMKSVKIESVREFLVEFD